MFLPRRTTAARLLAVAALLAAAAAVALPLPWACIAVAFVLALGALQALAPTSALRALCFNLAVPIAIFAGLEVWAFDQGLVARSEAARMRGDRVYSLVADAEMGYALRPSQTRVARRWHDQDLVYRTRNSHDAQGRRISPEQTRAPDGRDAILFFGGSFTYGEGVSDEQTTAYVVGDLLGDDYAIYNFGVSGYGPQHMLSLLERHAGAIAPDRPRFIIYQTLRDHVYRAAGRSPWLANGPHYALGAEGLARVDEAIGGRDDRWFRRLVETSHLAKLIRGRDWFVPAGDIEVYLAIVDASRRVVTQRFPDAEFHVLLWDVAASPLSRAMVSGLRQRGIEVHLVSEILPNYVDISSQKSPQRLSPYEAHPSAEAHRLLARFVAEKIVREGEGPDGFTPRRQSAKSR